MNHSWNSQRSGGLRKKKSLLWARNGYFMELHGYILFQVPEKINTTRTADMYVVVKN